MNVTLQLSTTGKPYLLNDNDVYNKLHDPKLIDWLFNGTSIQKGQFVPTAGKGNWLMRLSNNNNFPTDHLSDDKWGLGRFRVPV